MVSRADALWRVDLALLLPPSDLDVDEDEEPIPDIPTLQSWPVGTTRPEPPRMTSGDLGFYKGARAELLMVGPDHVAVRQGGGGIGGYPISWDRIRVKALEPVVTLGFNDRHSLPIGEILGEAVETALMEREPEGCAGPYEKNWALIRTEGRWIVRGSHSPMAGFCPPEILPFTLPVAPTADLVGDTGGVVPWEVLAGVHEGLTDAVSAPSGRTTLLVFRDHLAVAVDDRIVSEHAEAGQAIVAAQWAPTIRDSGA